MAEEATTKRLRELQVQREMAQGRPAATLNVHASIPSPEDQSRASERLRAREVERARYEESMRRMEISRHWFEAQPPRRHLPMLGKWSDPPEFVAKRKWLYDRAGAGYLVALLGNRGNGKTQMATDAMWEQCLASKRVRYSWAFSFFLDVRATFDGGEGTEQAVVASYVAWDLLVIEEIAVRGGTQFEDNLLIHTIDQRYAAMKDTILISNQTPEAFRASMGESVIDRLRETGGIIECTWPSFREQNRDNKGRAG